MAETTQIHPDKVRAYQATDYRMGHTAQDIILNIGQRADRLAALFAAHGAQCGAFITALNPRGTVQSDAANDAAHAELLHLLQDLHLEYLEGSGIGQDNTWPAERSYFAFGLELEPAKDIGRHFDQDAIVWVGPDAIPQLILLR